jgi:hypothetical protein
VGGHKVPQKDVFTFLLALLFKGKDLLFVLVHRPHGLEGETQGGDSIHGLEEVVVHSGFIPGKDREMTGGDAVIVSSFVGNLEHLIISWFSDGGYRFQLGHAWLDVISVEKELIGCDFTRNSVSVVHLVSLELLDLLDGVD